MHIGTRQSSHNSENTARGRGWFRMNYAQRYLQMLDRVGTARGNDRWRTMVEGGAAGGIEDAAGVQLELALVRLDGHAHRLVRHGLQIKGPCRS